MRDLMPHQEKALEIIKDKKIVALFMQMRLGKTMTCIRHLSRGDKPKRILILTPKSVAPAWKTELFYEEIDDDVVEIVTGNSTKKIEMLNESKHMKELWAITNYESVIYCPEVLDFNWDVIVLDESTRIKSPKSTTTKMLSQYTTQIPEKMILTGCPSPESELDYFEQIKFLKGTCMGHTNFWHWRTVNFDLVGYDWIIKPKSLKLLMDEIAEVAVVMTRKDAGLGKKRIYSRRYSFLQKGEQADMYQELCQDFMTTCLDKEFSTKFVPVQLEWMSRIASGFSPDGKKILSNEKLKEVEFLMRGELSKEKVVVWCKHNEEIYAVKNHLESKRFKVGVFMGEDKSGLSDFQSGKIQVLCGQPMCGKMGIDLSVSSTAIYFSNWWSNEIRMQSEDRILNVRQDDPLLFIDLICKYSIEEDIYGAVRSKKIDYNDFTSRLKARIKKMIK